MNKPILPQTSDSGQDASGQPADEATANRNEKTPAPDPFDPDSLRLTQDFASTVGVRKLITTVRCTKPHRQEFFRVRSGEDWRLQTGLFEDKATREYYLVDRDLWPELGDEVKPVCLFTVINRQGTISLWPAKLPGADGRSNSWNDSALKAAAIAESSWIKLVPNMRDGFYEVHQATGNLSEPEWPDELTFRELLRLCFQDRRIAEIDHPILRALRGEV